METANAGRSISGNLEVNDDNDSKIQLPLSAESLEKSSYVQDSPPICYVDLGCHKSTESDFQVFQGQKISNDVNPCDLAPDLPQNEYKALNINEDIKSDFVRNTVCLNSAEQSTVHVRDGSVDECTPIISTPHECAVYSSVVQEQKNTTITSTPGPLLNCPSLDQPENSPVVVDLEKEPLELADSNDDDLEDRPLVVDLGDTRNTPSPIGSSPASPVVVAAEVAPNTFRRPLPPSKIPPKGSPKVASASSTVPTSNSTPRVQKPIRPFIPRHFTPRPEVASITHTTTTQPVTTVTLAQVAPPLSATAIRLHQPMPPSQLPPLPTPTLTGAPAGGAHQPTNGVQFMSLITPPPPPPPPPPTHSGVSPSPIQLFNLATMPGYLNAASGVLFQSLPPSAAGGGAVGQTSAPGGGFQFSPPGPPPPPPPSLFAPQNFPPPLFARPPGSISTNAPSASGGGLPPPPPLAPAPGITSLQQAAGSSRPPLTGLFIHDLSTWMAGVTCAQTIPPLQPIFAHPASITTATISSGEVIYSTVLTPNVAPVSSNASTTSNTTSVARRPTPPAPLPANPPPISTTPVISVALKSESDSSINGSLPSTKSMPITATATTVATSTITTNFSISARRWRPSGTDRQSAVASPEITSTASAITTTVDISSTSIDTITTPAVTSENSKFANIFSEEVFTSRNRNSIPSIEDKQSHIISEKETSAKTQTAEHSGVSLASRDVIEEGEVSKVNSEPSSVPNVPSTKNLPSVSHPAPPPHVTHSKSRGHTSKKTRPSTTTQLQSQQQQSKQAMPKRKIISHVIEGHVLYESNLPFPVRNAMAVVRATLKSNGTVEESHCTDTSKNHSRSEVVENNASDVKDSMMNGTHSQLEDDGIALSTSIARQRHSMSLPQHQQQTSSDTRKRHLLKSEASRSRSNEGRNNGEKKKRRRGSTTHHTPPPPLDSVPIHSSAQNGHKNLSNISTDSGKSSEDRVNTSSEKLTVKVKAPVISESNETPLPSSGAASSSSNTSLKVTIHPVYQSTPSETSTQSMAEKSKTKISPVTVKPPLLSPTLPVVSTATPPPPSAHPSTSPSSQSRGAPASVLIAPPTTLTYLNVGPGSRALPPPPPPPGPVNSWSPRSVAEFVRTTPSCASYAEIFEVNEIDGEALLLLSISDFIQPPMKMKIGHALKLAHRVQEVAGSTSPTPSNPSTSGGGRASL